MKLQHMNRRKIWAGVVVVTGIAAVLLALAVLVPVPKTQAQSPQYPKVIDSDSVVFGRTYSEWSAAWEQWSYSIPVDQHPLFDNGDCSVGQSGPVWFLGGKFCANGATCSFTGIVRSCSVPFGKALYFPVINGEDSALEESLVEHPGDETYQQIATLRAFEESAIGSANVYCWIDGAPIPNLQTKFRVQSTAFGFTLPANNLLASVYGNSSFVAGTYFPAVDDGWYVMVGPLPPGPHSIHFQAMAGGFQLEVTYHLNVGGR